MHTLYIWTYVRTYSTYIHTCTVYGKLKEEAIDRTLWITLFGGGYGPVVRHNDEWWHSVCIIEHYIRIRTSARMWTSNGSRCTHCVHGLDAGLLDTLCGHAPPVSWPSASRTQLNFSMCGSWPICPPSPTPSHIG
jgi:hypothetical protein